MVLVRFNKDTKVWDIIEKENSIEGDLYLDGLLKKKLDFGKKQIKKNNDVVGIVCGDEGSGKSTLAGNVMEYMTDGEFNPITNMIGAEDINSVMAKIEDTPNGGSVLFDEGNSFFLSTETMKKEQRNLHKLFSIFRQKNLFVLIVAPSFFRLNSYFALDRSRFLLKTYLRNGERGCFEYYGDKRKSKLYRIGKATHDFSAVAPNIRGKFTKCYALENPEYIEYKEKTLKHIFESFKRQEKKIPTETEIKRKLVKDIIKKNKDKSSRDIGELIGLSERRVQQLKKDLKKDSADDNKSIPDEE